MSTSSATTTPTTPTSSTTSNISCSPSGLDDINYLLYLETLKRFKDDESHIRRQVEEKTRQYHEIKVDYLQQYAKYVTLVKLAATRTALEQRNFLDGGEPTQTDAALEDVASIAQKLSTGILTDYIDSNELALCKQLLRNSTAHNNLGELQRELAANKASVRAIQAATEAVEATVDTATVQGLGYFVDALQLGHTEN